MYVYYWISTIIRIHWTHLFFIVCSVTYTSLTSYAGSGPSTTVSTATTKSMCQTSCDYTVTCTAFGWYPNSNPNCVLYSAGYTYSLSFAQQHCLSSGVKIRGLWRWVAVESKDNSIHNVFVCCKLRHSSVAWTIKNYFNAYILFPYSLLFNLDIYIRQDSCWWHSPKLSQRLMIASTYVPWNRSVSELCGHQI